MSAPGWYPDPSGAPGQRYFDGRQWTENRVPAVPPLKKRKSGLQVFFIGFGVVLAGFVGFLMLLGSTVHDGTNSGNSSGNSVASAGSVVRDGQFAFQVIGFGNVGKVVRHPTGNPYMTATAQGTFIVLTLTVMNVGDQPASYFGQNQKLIDTGGRQFGVSSDADLYINGSNNMMGDINPGNGMQVKVAFDVPVGTVPAKLKLHDSMLSGGVTVALDPPK
jgi:hypothetical protein